MMQSLNKDQKVKLADMVLEFMESMKEESEGEDEDPFEDEDLLEEPKAGKPVVKIKLSPSKKKKAKK